MNQFLHRYRIFLYSLLSDIVCVFGVFIFNWSILNVMLFYWLDVVIMVFFVSVFIKKVNKAEFSPGMLPGMALVLGLLVVFYFGIIAFADKQGYKIPPGFLMAFQPTFMLPVFLVTALVNNYNEYRNYTLLLNGKNPDPFIYPKLWIIRFFGVELILFGLMAAKADEALTILLVISLKWAILAWQRSKNRSA